MEKRTINLDSAKFPNLLADTQFAKELIEGYNLGNTNFMGTNRAVYNLLISRRDINLWLNGIMPHKYWRLGDVKQYFGLKGGRKTILKNFMKVYNEHEEFKTYLVSLDA